MEYSCRKAAGPLRGDSLPLTTKPPGVPRTYLVDLGGRMKDWVDLAAKRCSCTWNPWVWNPAPQAVGPCFLSFV